MPLKTTRDELPAMNLTSMIDVMLVLVIFFMVAARFSDVEHSLDVKVPQVGAAGPLISAPQKKIINVHGDGHVTLDGRTVTLVDLKLELKAARREYAKLGVIVRGDAQGAFQHVANVLAVCREAGIAELGISVSVAAGEGATHR